MSEQFPSQERERKIEVGAKTEKGSRPKNEDALVVDEEHGLFAVFDGLGGHQAGNLASAMAAEIVREECAKLPANADFIQIESAIDAALLECNARIFEAGANDPQEDPEHPKLRGTTASIIKLWKFKDKTGVTIGHIGDSRVYRIRPSGSFEQITQDDGVARAKYREGEITYGEYLRVQEVLDAAKEEEDLTMGNRELTEVLEEAWDTRNQIYAYLGKGRIAPRISTVQDCGEGDIFFITSDGVHDLLITSDIQHCIQEGGTAQEIAERLVARAQAANGDLKNMRRKSKLDDASAVVIRL